MSAVVPFVFEDRLFRAVTIGDALWFVAGDVARILGYRDANTLTRGLPAREKGTHSMGTPYPPTGPRGSRMDDPDERGTRSVRTPYAPGEVAGSLDDGKDRHSAPTPGGAQDVSIISEPGLYRAIATRRVTQSLKPEVRALIERFQDWFFHDVIPTLRRTGCYVMPGASNVDDLDDLDDATSSAAPPAVQAELAKLAKVRLALRVWGLKGARATWIAAGEPDLSPLLAAAVHERALPAASVVMDAVVALMARPECRGVWTGSATDLLTLLAEVSGPGVVERVDWPRTPQGLSGSLDRAKTSLAARGLRITRRHSGIRTITIEAVAP